MLITVLGKLDEINKQEVIRYYDKLISEDTSGYL